jgi:acyl carrier protein
MDLLAESLEIDRSELTEESELRSFDTFDSIGVLTLIGLLEDRVGYVLNPDKIGDLRTAADLCQLVNESA